MAAASPYGNLINPLDPSSAINAYQIQRQQALAQALQQQSLAPMTSDIPQNMPIMPKLGIGHGLVKMAQALMAGQAGEAADRSAGMQQQQNMASMLQAMGGGAPGGMPASAGGDSSQPMAAQGDPSQAAPQQPMRTGLNPTGASPQAAALAMQLDPQKYLESVIADSARTPEMKNNAAMGYTGPMQLAAKRAMDLKNAESDRKVGNQFFNYLDPSINGMVPKIPDNAQVNGPIAANGSILGGVDAIPGANDVQRVNAVTAAEAAAGVKPVKVFNKDSGGFDYSNEADVAKAGRTPTTESNIRGKAGLRNGYAEIPASSPEMAALEARIAGTSDPAKRSQIIKQATAKPYAAEPPAGFEKGQVSSQEELSKAYSAQKDAHQQSQTTDSYLTEIVQQAKKAAVGPQSDKMQFVNGLLSMAGNDRATDAVTANNLLDKYSNQIVARLGGGGMGTDAAREILKSAYPSAKMNVPAIEDAAANIKGANAMTRARTEIVAPYGDNRDPVGFSQAARTFDQNADPRIFQFMSMSPEQKTAFKLKMSPAEAADFRKRGAALDAMGVTFK